MKFPFVPKTEREELAEAGFSGFFGITFDRLEGEPLELINRYLDEADMDFYITRTERVSKDRGLPGKYVMFHRSRR